MSFKEKANGIECETVQKKTCFINYGAMLEIHAYTLDLFTYDELRISIETTHGITYQFSEEEDGWQDLLSWLKSWCKLENNWFSSAYPEPFSSKVTKLWSMNA